MIREHHLYVADTLLTTPDTGDMKCRTSAVEFKHCMWIQFEMVRSFLVIGYGTKEVSFYQRSESKM